MATRRVPLARQPGHQRLVPPGPLVLGRAPLKPPAPAADRDRPVSRRSEPSSRTALMGEQPNPWDRLQPQDAMRVLHHFWWRRLYLHPDHRRVRGPAFDGCHRLGLLKRSPGQAISGSMPSVVTGSKELVSHLWGYMGTDEIAKALRRLCWQVNHPSIT
jgi:hypothetical protein